MTYVRKKSVDMLRFLCYDRYQVSEKKKPIRRHVDWNTGERVHKPKKGKGSYERKKKFDK